MADATLKGNASGAPASPSDLTVAQGRALLKIDQRKAVADANYTALSSDTLIAYTSLTATRTVTLPAANAVNAGAKLVVIDESGSVTVTKAITVARAGTDTINGGTSYTISAAYGAVELESNGSNAWTTISMGTPAPALVFVQEISLSSASLCEVAVPADAKELILEIENMVTSTSALLYMQFSSGGTYATSGYNYQTQLGNGTTNTAAGAAAAAQIVLGSPTAATYAPFFATLKIRQPAANGPNKTINMLFGAYMQLSGVMSGHTSGILTSITNPLDKVKLYPSTGTFSGTVRVYKQVG